MRKYFFTLFCLVLLAGCAVNQLKPKRMTRAYFEYSRGKSFPVRTDIGMAYGTSDYTLHGVYLEDESFFPDRSIIPNAFLGPLLEGRFGHALDAFTEPYYGYRLLHFFKKIPRFGIGIEFIHHKIFLLDKDQQIRISGIYNGEKIDKQVRIGDHLDEFGVSHGINHVSLSLIYRWLLSRTPYVPDGRIQPFVSLSAGPTAPHLELDLKDVLNSEREAYSFQWGRRNWGLGLGLGVRYKTTRHVGFYLEYKLTYSHLFGMHFDNDADTRVMMDFFSHHLQWGISIML